MKGRRRIPPSQRIFDRLRMMKHLKARAIRGDRADEPESEPVMTDDEVRTISPDLLAFDRFVSENGYGPVEPGPGRENAFVVCELVYWTCG